MQKRCAPHWFINGAFLLSPGNGALPSSTLHAKRCVSPPNTLRLEFPFSSLHPLGLSFSVSQKPSNMSLPFLDCNPSLFLASSQPFSRRLHPLSFSFSQTSNMSLPFLDCNPSLFLASSQPVCRRDHNRLHIFCWYSTMGQVLGRLQGKLWRQKQVRQITERVFDRIKNDSGRANLKFEDLYIAVLLVYNDINKLLPGPHFDPPSKEHVRTMIQICDFNLDGEINLEEFVTFIQQLTTETLITVSEGLILTLLVVPIIAVATKNAIESVPGCGKMVKKLPYSVYAFLVTLAVVFIQRLILSCLGSK